jgi:hypothetical protein
MMADSTTALIAAGTSLLVAMLSAVAAYKAQSRSIANQSELQRYQRDLKRLQAELDERRAERDARRDYEYDALKRLYAECSPLTFSLAEQGSSMRDRIRSLAQAAMGGDLGAGQSSWLSAGRLRYYRQSTEYRLVAPLATAKLLQRRLTQLDLSLDPGLRLVHLLARQLVRLVSDDFSLAGSKIDPLKYLPHAPDAEVRAGAESPVYRQQGIPSGILDYVSESLIVSEKDAPPRVATYMEFENARSDGSTAIGKAFRRVEYLFADFHPQERPVLWRLLLAMSSLHRAIDIAADRYGLELSRPSVESLLLLPASEVLELDWRESKADDKEGQKIVAAHAAVNAYLLENLRKPVELCLSALNAGSPRQHAGPAA